MFKNLAQSLGTLSSPTHISGEKLRVLQETLDVSFILTYGVQFRRLTYSVGLRNLRWRPDIIQEPRNFRAGRSIYTS